MHLIKNASEGMENCTEMELLGQKIHALKLTSNKFALYSKWHMFPHPLNNTGWDAIITLDCHLLGER